MRAKKSRRKRTRLREASRTDAREAANVCISDVQANSLDGGRENLRPLLAAGKRQAAQARRKISRPPAGRAKTPRPADIKTAPTPHPAQQIIKKKQRQKEGTKNKKTKPCLRARIVFKKFKNYSYFLVNPP